MVRLSSSFGGSAVLKSLLLQVGEGAEQLTVPSELAEPARAELGVVTTLIGAHGPSLGGLRPGNVVVSGPNRQADQHPMSSRKRWYQRPDLPSLMRRD